MTQSCAHAIRQSRLPPCRRSSLAVSACFGRLFPWIRSFFSEPKGVQEFDSMAPPPHRRAMRFHVGPPLGRQIISMTRRAAIKCSSPVHSQISKYSQNSSWARSKLLLGMIRVSKTSPKITLTLASNPVQRGLSHTRLLAAIEFALQHLDICVVRVRRGRQAAEEVFKLL